MSAPKGHRNLGIRGATTLAQCLLTLINLSYEINIPIGTMMAICQFWAGITLIVQWRTANPRMFIARAVPSYIRCVLSFYAAGCGRRWPWEECNVAAWSDVRKVFRVLHCVAAVRFFFNGLSLTLQFKYPKRGVGQYGNEQLFYRGCVRLVGIPLHLTRAMLKLGELAGTEFEKRPVEIFVNLTRALIVVPIAAWSLLNQWATSGTGKKTDDIRTSEDGSIHVHAPTSFANFVEPHQGDRNLLIRSVVEFAQFFFSMWLVCYNIDAWHMSVRAMCELVTCLALLYQWRHDHDGTHYVRAFVSFLTVPSFLHLGVCGYKYPWQECDYDAWSGIRRPFRILMCTEALRMLANGVSLALQKTFPNRGVTARYGNEQLLFRSIIRGFGCPLYFAVTMQAFVDFNGTKWQRPPIELVVNLIRCFVMLPISTYSLGHQWRFTGTEDKPRCTPEGQLNSTQLEAKPSGVPPAESGASDTAACVEVLTDAAKPDIPDTTAEETKFTTLGKEMQRALVWNGVDWEDVEQSVEGDGRSPPVLRHGAIPIHYL